LEENHDNLFLQKPVMFQIERETTKSSKILFL